MPLDHPAARTRRRDDIVKLFERRDHLLGNIRRVPIRARIPRRLPAARLHIRHHDLAPRGRDSADEVEDRRQRDLPIRADGEATSPVVGQEGLGEPPGPHLHAAVRDEMEGKRRASDVAQALGEASGIAISVEPVEKDVHSDEALHRARRGSRSHVDPAGPVVLGGEMAVPGGFYLLFFGVGALLVGLIGLAGIDLAGWAQWLLFSIFSLISLALIRPRILGRFRQAGPGIDDTLVGEIATATEPIAAGALGRGELRGSTFAVRNADAEAIGLGERCRVVRVDGLTLEVRKEAARA